ncbi:MAG: hypothetical protein K0R61_126 [Microvirga sp.]|jgi:hypothetical protein|nr:hypothetical protein [Microvirga sp.]
MPKDLAQAALEGWPQTGVELKKEDFQDVIRSIADRIGDIPRDTTSYPDQLIVVQPAGGTAPVGAPTVTGVDFANRRVIRAAPHQVKVTATRALTWNEHHGAQVFCESAAEIVLSANRDANPDEGLDEGFICQIIQVGTGTVRLIPDSSFEPLTSAFRIAFQGGAMTVQIFETKLFVWGNTMI